MARTSLGPWKFIQDMGSSNHWGLIMVAGKEANGDNLGSLFDLYNNGMFGVLIRMALMRFKSQSTQYGHVECSQT